jgi:hypothetical protein
MNARYNLKNLLKNAQQMFTHSATILSFLIFKLGFNLIVMLGRILQKCALHFGLVSSFKRLRNKMKDDINFLLVLGLIDNKMWIKLLD